MAARLEMLEQDAHAATSAAARTKVRKQIESLRKKQTELLAFDEKLRHCADLRITLHPRPRRRRQGQLRQIWRLARQREGRDRREWR